MGIEITACFIVLFLVGMIIVFLLRTARDASIIPIALTPSDMEWVDHISSYHNDCIQVSDFLGNIKKPGPYSRRITLPANRKENPHYHLEKARTVTVLSGTLYFAYGDTYDESKLKAFPPGSFITEPKNVSHFVLTKNEEVVLQISGIGPSKSVYLDNN